MGKKEHDIDDQVNQINDQILEVRDSSQLLNKRETRLQTLEIEYLRVQNNAAPNDSTHSMDNQAPAYKQQHINLRDLQQLRQINDFNPREQHPQQLPPPQGMIKTHSLKSVISKYVKNNQHARRTINHHKSWLKSFQNELRNVSDSISHDKVSESHRHHHHKRQRQSSKHKLHSTTLSKKKHESNASAAGQGEVVIRVKIEK